MDFKTRLTGSAGLAAVAADALLVVVAGTSVPEGLDAPLAAALQTGIADGDFSFKAGSSLLLHKAAGVKAPRLLFVAGGDGSVKSWRKAVATGVAALKGGGSRELAVVLVGADAAGEAFAEALVAAVHEAVYVYRHTKPSAPAASPLSGVKMLCDKASAATLGDGLRRGAAIAAGVELARECANRPGNHCTPGFLADEAERLGKDHDLKVEVLDRKDVEKLGMGAFLAVAQGSHEPLKFIVARWNGAAKSRPPVVLVGKGITFDTGGISIKPAGEMDEMKFDMGGAASVLGTLLAVASLKAKVNLVGIIPACENMPDGKAVKPGDVVTSLSGQTIES
jgi:leucyl aminopeptidase